MPYTVTPLLQPERKTSSVNCMINCLFPITVLGQQPRTVSCTSRTTTPCLARGACSPQIFVVPDYRSSPTCPVSPSSQGNRTDTVCSPRPAAQLSPPSNRPIAAATQHPNPMVLVPQGSERIRRVDDDNAAWRARRTGDLDIQTSRDGDGRQRGEEGAQPTCRGAERLELGAGNARPTRRGSDDLCVAVQVSSPGGQ